EGYFRFFAYLGLFIFMMTNLVMAENLVMLYLGWEGVGLCSYLLIGYYYEKPSAREAAKKAFLVNRVGDFGFALGIMSCFYTIARCSTLFFGNDAAMMTIAVIGAFTAIFSASIALRQFDLKKVFAYSTVSQLGFMFVGVGVLTPVAGVFHLVTHAFFKALLF